MNRYEAQVTMNDIAMRAALWEWLMAHRPDNLRGRIGPNAPNDDIVQEDIKRILFPKRRWFGLAS